MNKSIVNFLARHLDDMMRDPPHSHVRGYGRIWWTRCPVWEIEPDAPIEVYSMAEEDYDINHFTTGILEATVTSDGVIHPA